MIVYCRGFEQSAAENLTAASYMEVDYNTAGKPSLHASTPPPAPWRARVSAQEGAGVPKQPSDKGACMSIGTPERVANEF